MANPSTVSNKSERGARRVWRHAAAHQGHGRHTGVRSDSAWTGLIMPPFPWLAVCAMRFGGTTISVWMFWEAVPACQNIRRANGKAPLHTHTYTCESSITAACHTWLDTKLMVQQQRDREGSSRKIVFWWERTRKNSDGDREEEANSEEGWQR